MVETIMTRSIFLILSVVVDQLAFVSVEPIWPKEIWSQAKTKIVFEMTVINQGAEIAGGVPIFEVKMFYSADDKLDADDREIAREDIKLPSGNIFDHRDTMPEHSVVTLEALTGRVTKFKNMFPLQFKICFIL